MEKCLISFLDYQRLLRIRRFEVTVVHHEESYPLFRSQNWMRRGLVY